MVKYCLYTNNVTEDCIQEALDDIMDQEFETICEDNSTKGNNNNNIDFSLMIIIVEIAKILYKFLDLLKQQNVEEFQAEYNKLPISQVATTSKLTQNGNSRKKVEESDSSDLDSESPMEEDSGWVTVKSRRKH